VRALARVAGVVLAIAYPAVLYVGFTRWGVRAVGLAVASLAALRALVALAGRSRDDVAAVLRTIAPVAALAGLSAVVGDPRFLLALPVLINGALLASFGASLRRGPPMVERFARMQVADLSDAERAHCREATVAWCVLFVVNASASAALALAGQLRAWAVYTGGVAYGLIGLLFAAEFVVRTYRFRALRRTAADRLFARIFPVTT
jgi:uncharacterized membrane protein